MIFFNHEFVYTMKQNKQHIPYTGCLSHYGQCVSTKITSITESVYLETGVLIFRRRIIRFKKNHGNDKRVEKQTQFVFSTEEYLYSESDRNSVSLKRLIVYIGIQTVFRWDSWQLGKCLQTTRTLGDAIDEIINACENMNSLIFLTREFSLMLTEKYSRVPQSLNPFLITTKPESYYDSRKALRCY